MLRLPEMAPVQHDVVQLTGGMDEISSSYAIAPGVLRQCLNFAVRPNGGYYRIPGYERFDGQLQPSDAKFLPLAVEIYPGYSISVGDTGTFGNVSGTVCFVEPYGRYISLTKTIATFSSDFTAGPIVINGDTVGEALGLATGLTAKEASQNKAAAANTYRADILPVPGSGPIRGVVYYKGNAYAFRDNATGTACDIYKSSPTGWVNVPLGKRVSFTGLKGDPKENDMLVQGAVTAQIDRWIITSGTTTGGDAAGYFVISQVLGGNFSAGVAAIDNPALPDIEVTLSGPESEITIAPGGKYSFSIGNFTAYYDTERIYGADGVNDAFEFDGEIYVPLSVETDYKPKYAQVHASHLFLAVGSSVIHSALGNPYNFEVINGAGEIGTGGLITGMLVLPGDQGTAALQVTSRNSTWILYGNSSQDWRFVNYNVGVGAVDRSLQNLFSAFAMDDKGVVNMQQSLNYGNFDAATITYNIQRFIRDQQGKVTCSDLNRANSQYRVFYNNGFSLYSTVTPQGVVGHGICLYPDAALCCWNGENDTGESVNLFGTENGLVMRNDRGSSFDGEMIQAYFNTNINSVESPRIRKRFRRCVVEVLSESFALFDVTYSFEWASPMILPHSVVNAPASLAGNAYWDQAIWDTFYWDGKTTDAVTVNLEGTGENMQFMLLSRADYVESFTIPSITVAYTQRRSNR